MNRLSMWCGLCMLGLAMVVGTGASQDAKKEKKESGKLKGFLPAGFKDLGLSSDQVQKIYAIHAEYDSKIAELNRQVGELKAKRSKEPFNVLTKDQLEKYLKAKGLEGKDKVPAREKDKKVEEKKTDEKKTDDKK